MFLNKNFEKGIINKFNKKMFLKELKNFLKENSWVFIVFAIALVIVLYTGRGNIIHLIVPFVLSIFGEVFYMCMLYCYSKKEYKIGSIYQIGIIAFYASVGIYGLIFFAQAQYLLFQLAYFAGALKALIYYNFAKDLKFINPSTLIILNIILLFILFFVSKDNTIVNSNVFSFIVAIAFSVSSTGTSSMNDKFRYWMLLVGGILLIIGTSGLLVLSYTAGNLDGAALGRFILPLGALIYQFKIIKKYL